MSDHQIAGLYNFEFWRGTPPPLIGQNVSVHTRAGADGVGEQKLGKWHEPIVCQLESHFPSYLLALNTLPLYFALRGAGLVDVIYNLVNWQAFNVRFYVDRVEFVRCQSAVRLIGPNYNYASGAKLITEWTLTAQDIS